MQPPENQQYPQYPYQQPGSFSQPPQQPGRVRRFVSWYGRQGGCMKIVVALGIIFVVLFVCSAAVSGVVQGISESSGTPTPAAAAAATSAPTQAPTATPTPSPTSKPLTLLEQVQKIVSDNATQDNHNGATLSGDVVIANVTLNEALDNSAYKLVIQDNCYNIEKALWSAHLKISDANITFRAPATDNYGNPTSAVAGFCELSKETAAKFNWPGLTPQTAWNAYDQASFSAMLNN